MKHVALITASIEVIAGKHVVTCLEAPDIKASADDEETAIAMARKVATLALGDALRRVLDAALLIASGNAFDVCHIFRRDLSAQEGWDF